MDYLLVWAMEGKKEGSNSKKKIGDRKERRKEGGWVGRAGDRRKEVWG